MSTDMYSAKNTLCLLLHQISKFSTSMCGTHWDSPPPIMTHVLGQTGRLQRERQLGNPFAFWGLKKVVVRYYCDDDLERPIHHIISLLMIPSVETFRAIDQNAATISCYPPVETDVDEESLRAASQDGNLELTNMKELSLSFTAIRPNSLLQLWRCCPNLKILYYKDGFGLSFEDWMDLDELKGINLMATASCLNPHLRDLTILNAGHVWSSIKDSSIGSLVALKGLHSLRTTWETFLCRGDVNDEKKYFPSIRDIVDAIPQSLELLHISGGLRHEDSNHNRALAAIFMLLKQKRRFPAPKTLDFGWKSRSPNEPWKYDWEYHQGFTQEDYKKVIARCQKSGIELILEPLTRSPKYIYYHVDDDGKVKASGTNKVKHVVHYPYDDYERICNENGCDLKTGRPHRLEEIIDTDW